MFQTTNQIVMGVPQNRWFIMEHAAMKIGDLGILPSGKHTKNYGKSENHHVSRVNQLFEWPCSKANCEFR